MCQDAIRIRDITEAGEMRAVEELQKEVWRMSDRDIVSVFMLRATVASGGVLVGAYERGDVLVGRPTLHSDMLAVKPGYRLRGIGRRLKLAQRDRALARGLRVMTWTFDPLQSRNARLNFSRLGVLSDRYFVDFYGRHSSSFLHSTGTDRLWVTWLLDSPRVEQRIRAGAASQPPPPAVQEAHALVRVGPGEAPQVSDADASTNAPLLIEIPADIGAIQEQRPALARDWRQATRRAFTGALRAGRLVQDFFLHERDGRKIGTYLLTSGKLLEDFN
jgi:predicted GNAT superfamily acetyltransferase